MKAFYALPDSQSLIIDISAIRLYHLKDTHHHGLHQKIDLNISLNFSECNFIF